MRKQAWNEWHVPAPWREGLSPELIRVLEDAFASVASRTRALLSTLHYGSVDEDVRGRPFVPAVGRCRLTLSNPSWKRLEVSA